MSYTYGKSTLEQQIEDRLVLVRDLKADNIERYFTAMKKQVTLFSNDATVINAMKDLNAGFIMYAKEVSTKGLDKYKDAVIKKYIAEFSNDYANDNGGLTFDATPYLNLSNENTFALQYNYIFNNPNGIDKEEKLAYVDDGSTYSKFHSKYHEQLKDLKLLFGMEDIFLVDAKSGDIVYTVAKGLDFTTSLKNGPYANTALGKAFRDVNTDDGIKSVVVSQFEAYSPSNDDQAIFLATPIFDNGLKIGVLIFQLSSDVINSIMTSDSRWQEIGLGKTGETYLIDNQHRMISSSRLAIEDPDAYYKRMEQAGIDQNTIIRMKAKGNNIGLVETKSLAVDEALQGKTGFAMFKDYRGVEVLGAYEPINVSGLNWGIVAKMDKSEAFAPIYNLAYRMAVNLAGVLLLILIFAVIVGMGLAKQISVPIEKLSLAMRLLAQSQDLTRRVDYAAKDEIGDMAQALNTLLDSFQKTCQETIISSQKVQTTAHKLMNLADEIESRESMHKFEDNYDSVHEKTEEIKDASDGLAELSARLQVLSRQFKVFEEESDRTSSW
jgi:methyl-accepting chemotaxis protein